MVRMLGSGNAFLSYSPIGLGGCRNLKSEICVSHLTNIAFRATSLIETNLVEMNLMGMRLLRIIKYLNRMGGAMGAGPVRIDREFPAHNIHTFDI